jgi:hypothetical protein
VDAVVIKSARLKWLAYLVLALGFVAMGVFLIRSGQAVMVGWVNVAFFGGGAALFIKQLLDPRPRIIISDQGLLDRTLKVDTIEWADVRDVHLQYIRGSPFLCVDLTDSSKYTSRLSAMNRRMVALNRRLGFTELSLNLAGTDADPERLATLIRTEIARRAAVPPPN